MHDRHQQQLWVSNTRAHPEEKFANGEAGLYGEMDFCLSLAAYTALLRMCASYTFETEAEREVLERFRGWEMQRTQSTYDVMGLEPIEFANENDSDVAQVSYATTKTKFERRSAADRRDP